MPIAVQVPAVNENARALQQVAVLLDDSAPDGAAGLECEILSYKDTEGKTLGKPARLKASQTDQEEQPARRVSNAALPARASITLSTTAAICG